MQIRKTFYYDHKNYCHLENLFALLRVMLHMRAKKKGIIVSFQEVIVFQEIRGILFYQAWF